MFFPSSTQLNFNIPLKALGIPFVLHGASEVNARFREIFTKNYECAHVWHTMQDQVEGSSCILHPSSEMCGKGAELDLWIMGTPCPPFSEQNMRRNLPGAVESHPLYQVTFKDALEALQLGHKAYVLEQVMGFRKPYDPSTDETPLQRSLVLAFWVQCSV